MDLPAAKERKQEEAPSALPTHIPAEIIGETALPPEVTKKELKEYVTVVSSAATIPPKTPVEVTGPTTPFPIEKVTNPAQAVTSRAPSNNIEDSATWLEEKFPGRNELRKAA